MSVFMKELKLEEMNKVSGGDLHSHMMDFGERQYYQELEYYYKYGDEEEKEMATPQMKAFEKQMIEKYGSSIVY